MKAYNQPGFLTKTEETILFLLISNYSQQEIAQVLKCSRTEVIKIIAEGLCVKFELPILSTKLLIKEAIAKGYFRIIPQYLFNYPGQSFNKSHSLIEDIAPPIQLTEVEELILSMLIYSYSLSEIADYQNQSLYDVLEIVHNQLCRKFNTVSIIDLIKKADWMGYSIVMPEKLLPKYCMDAKFNSKNSYI